MYKPSDYNYQTRLDDGTLLLYNFLTGALNVLSYEEAEGIDKVFQDCNQAFSGQLGELKAELVEGKYLIPEKMNELEFIRIQNMSKCFSDASKYMVIMPTLDCNFNCTYCYETKEKGFISQETIQGLKRWISEIARTSKHFGIGWFGGEPLLDFSIIQEINGYAHEVCAENLCSFESNITTNGYLIPDQMIEQMDELGITSLQITLDGTGDQHNQTRPLRNGGPTFEVILNNIYRLLDQTQAMVRLRANVNTENYQSITDLLDLIPEKYRTEQLRLTFLKVFESPDEEAEMNKEVFAKRISQPTMMRDLFVAAMERGYHVQLPMLTIREQFCESCSKNYYVVHPSGDLYKCTVEYETGEPVGRITPEGELEVDPEKVIPWISTVAGDDEKCAQCKLLPYCYGGCPARRMKGVEPCPYDIQDIDGIIEMYYLSAKLGKELT